MNNSIHTVTGEIYLRSPQDILDRMHAGTDIVVESTDGCARMFLSGLLVSDIDLFSESL